MDTLITGSTGLVGSALRNFYPNAVCVSSKDADLTNWYETLNLIGHAKPDHVIHLAAEVGGLFKNMNDNMGMLERNIRIKQRISKLWSINTIYCTTYSKEKYL